MTRRLFGGILAVLGLVGCSGGAESPASLGSSETVAQPADASLADAAGTERALAESRWEADIQAFEAQDRVSPPPQGAILFVGSSSIRLWKTARDFADLPTINRGFGGSEMSDVVAFLDRIVLPYAPEDIVLYEGDNDIAKGKTAQRVFRDYRAFVDGVHANLPRARIHFIAIKPSLARWKLVETMRAANALVRAETENDPRLGYLDVDTPMLGTDGKPRPELFIDDGLHLSEAGYAIWNEVVRRTLRAPSDSGTDSDSGA
jgi:lysophospholipase L1-like esterase